MVPNPAASVGVSRPPQMPPITTAISPRIDSPPSICPRSAAESPAPGTGAACIGAQSGLRIA